MTRTFLLAAALLLPLVAVPTARSEEPHAPSVQEQLDDLKRGQDEILRELRSIRAALGERPAPVRGETPARPAAPVVLNVHGEPFKGAADAKVAIVAYSDFECSHCAEFATEVFPKIDAKYVATGKLKYFYRDLPEPGNREALLKAQLARCAGDQGRFWEMHDYLYLAKPKLVDSDLSNESKVVNIDADILAQCLKENKYPTIIQRSVLGAGRMGIRGTPTFFVGILTDGGDVLRIKETVLGVSTFEKFDEILSQLLGTASAPEKQ